MPSDEKDLRLLQAVFDGNLEVLKSALGAGATVDGSPELPCAPIVAATAVSNATLVMFLLNQGADPDKSIHVKMSCSSSYLEDGLNTAWPGERALHMASKSGNVEIVRLLLERSQADPNVTDNEGCTPLLSTCTCRYVCVEVVRLLLDSGADPGLAEKRGCIPLHFVALKGHTDLVEMLYIRAPATLHRFTVAGEPPFATACCGGQDGVVSKLLSLGAMEGRLPVFNGRSFLEIAVVNGSVAVARVLINEGGIGPDETRIAVVSKALVVAITYHRAALLLMLLMVDGAKKRSAWANTNLKGMRLLHCSAAFCYPAAVSILLEAGADEKALDQDGDTAGDCVGEHLEHRHKARIDRGGENAIRRMLERGPAYRARSWAWPFDKETGGDGGGDGDAASTPDAANWPPSAVKNSSVSGVGVVRLKGKKIGNKFFATLVARYCAKY